MFTIIGAMAELESSLISERVTAGMRAAKSRARSSVACPSHRISSPQSNIWPQKRKRPVCLH